MNTRGADRSSLWLCVVCDGACECAGLCGDHSTPVSDVCAAVATCARTHTHTRARARACTRAVGDTIIVEQETWRNEMVETQEQSAMNQLIGRIVYKPSATCCWFTLLLYSVGPEGGRRAIQIVDEQATAYSRMQTCRRAGKSKIMHTQMPTCVHARVRAHTRFGKACVIRHGRRNCRL